MRLARRYVWFIGIVSCGAASAALSLDAVVHSPWAQGTTTRRWLSAQLMAEVVGAAGGREETAT